MRAKMHNERRAYLAALDSRGVTAKHAIEFEAAETVDSREVACWVAASPVLMSGPQNMIWNQMLGEAVPQPLPQVKPGDVAQRHRVLMNLTKAELQRRLREAGLDQLFTSRTSKADLVNLLVTLK